MKKKVLLQIDHDDNASSFDSIVAIDSKIDHLLTYSDVTPIQIESIVHGAIFTRGPQDLHNTAIFFGGSDVEKTVELFEQAKKCFFGPMQVSMMADPNGSNTTAAAAVLCSQKHVELANQKVVILAATGPVGQRISRLTAAAGANVTVCSRSLERASKVCKQISAETDANLTPAEAGVPIQASKQIESADVVFAAGAAGIELLDEGWMARNTNVKLALDINAVPPVGIAGIDVTDKAEIRGKVTCYGAIGIGQLKMKIHKACIARLFETNDVRLDTDEIFKIGQDL